MRARAVLTLPVWLAGLPAVGCTGDLPSTATVTSLRLFALTTPTPAVRPGTPVRVTARWYDPTPGGTPGRSVWFHWRVCPTLPSGDARDCPLPGMGTDVATETTGAVDLPPGVFTLGTGSTDTDVVVYVALCPGAPSVYDPALGHDRCASPEGLEAIRRITVGAARPLNTNPGVQSLTLGDAPGRVTLDASTPVAFPVGCTSGGCPAVTLSVHPTADAAETLPDGGMESLEASFYVTGGTVDAPRVVGAPGATMALTTHWTPAPGAPGRTVRVWAVLRDQRGGDTVTAGALTLP